jgi:hypothetical protein
MRHRKLRAIAAVGLVVVVGLLALQVAYLDDKTGPIHPDAMSLALIALALALLAAVLDPRAARRMLRSLESFEGFGLKIARRVEGAERAGSLPDKAGEIDDDDDGVKTSERPKTGSLAGDVEKVAEVMGKRLRFARDALLPDPESLNEKVMVVRLRELGLVSQEEADLIEFVLGDDHEELEELSEGEQTRLLDYAWRVGTRLATAVFDRQVRARLRAEGWFVADFEQKKGHRPDFLALKETTCALLAARVGAPHSTVDNTRKRLERTQLPPGVTGRAVVVPDREQSPPERLEGEVLVLKLSTLAGDPKRLRPDSPDPG